MIYQTNTEPMWAPHKVRRMKTDHHRGKEKIRKLRSFRGRELAFSLRDRHT